MQPSRYAYHAAFDDDARSWGRPTGGLMRSPALVRILRVVPASAALIAVMGSGGCAKISDFRAEPRNVCAGEEVNLTWEACGQTTLDISPELLRVETESRGNRASFEIWEDTRFVLNARGIFNTVSAEVDVEVAPPDKGFGAVARCPPEQSHIETEVVLQNQIGSAFMVDGLTNVLDRPLIVEKGGRIVKLGAGERNPGLRGEAVQGTWRLKSPLAEGENCESALRSVRQRLQVRIHLLCGDS